jgi:hypothetical protein
VEIAPTTSTSTITAGSLGEARDRLDEFTKLLWGNVWSRSAADVEAEACLVDLLAQMDHNAVLDLKPQNIRAFSHEVIIIIRRMLKSEEKRVTSDVLHITTPCQS